MRETGVINELFYFPRGRRSTALSQITNLSGHNRKSTAGLAGACGFHGSIKRENVGLEGNPVDDLDDGCHFRRGVVNLLHPGRHLTHDHSILFHNGRCFYHKLVNLCCIAGSIVYGGRQLFQSGRRLFHRQPALRCGLTGLYYHC